MGERENEPRGFRISGPVVLVFPGLYRRGIGTTRNPLDSRSRVLRPSRDSGRLRDHRPVGMTGPGPGSGSLSVL